jgi:hypothetical protein
MHAIASATAAGGCVLDSWWTVREGSWPAWFYPGPDREADVALALMAYGGMAAETVVFRQRPKRGWYNDVVSATLRLGLLAGVSPPVLEELMDPLGDDLDDDLLVNTVLRRLGEVVTSLSGAHIGVGLRALEAEAMLRAQASVPAIAALAAALEDAPRLAGTEVARILDAAEWCGALGLPDLAGFFHQR